MYPYQTLSFYTCTCNRHLVFFLADAVGTDDPRARLTDEQRLYKELLRNYDRNTRPVYNASHPVNVNISISLTQIFDVVSTGLL